MDRRKDTHSELTVKAREAQKAHRWPEAEALWRQVLDTRPGDRTAQAGLGTVLIARGRIDEARALARAMLQMFPNDHTALMLVARAAADDEDWGAALEGWRSVLAIKDDIGVALTGVGTALLGMGDFKGADQWAETLDRRFPNDAYGAALSARTAAARGNAEGALQRWREAAERFSGATVRREMCRALLDAGHIDDAEAEAGTLLSIDREEGLTQIGNVLARRKPDDDHTDFWKSAAAEFPANTTFARRIAISALRAGRTDDAIEAMKVLLDGGTLWLAPASLIVGAVHALAANDDVPALRRWVRLYLKSVRGSGSYRQAALRLSRTIFAYFGVHKAPGNRSYRHRSQRMTERASLKPKARDLLGRVLTLEGSIAARTIALFETDVSRKECHAFIDSVREHVATRNAFSFVRINDGEGSAFPYERHLAEHFPTDAAEREHVWWGCAIVPAERARMSERVATAAWNADAIGIPNFARILRDVHLQANDDLSNTRTGRGLRAVLAAFERWAEHRPAGLAAPMFTSANLHQDLQRWNLYGELFDGAGELVLVTCHPDLPDVMRAKFGAVTNANILIPPRHATIPFLTKRAPTHHILPEIIDDVVNQVNAAAPGRVVVIGAGYLGKWIAHQAKQAGGIALDLGSALDYWMGLKTRSYQDLA